MDDYFLPDHVSPLAKGGILRFGISNTGPIAVAQKLALGHGNSQVVWGEALEKQLHEYYLDQRELHFEVFHDYIPNSGTYVDLDPRVKDCWGLPVARIHLDPSEHHQLAGGFLVDRGLRVLEAMGATSLEIDSVGEPTRVHAHGTCRAGVDPSVSVLDSFCQAHEVPNLFVVDGSFMPTSGGAAPTLTILANSFRTADHIVSRFRSGSFV